MGFSSLLIPIFSKRRRNERTRRENSARGERTQLIGVGVFYCVKYSREEKTTTFQKERKFVLELSLYFYGTQLKKNECFPNRCLSSILPSVSGGVKACGGVHISNMNVEAVKLSREAFRGFK